MLSRWLLPCVALSVLVGGNVPGAAHSLTGIDTNALVGTTITIPFHFTGATNITALQFDVLFEPAKLAANAVFAGPAAQAHQLRSRGFGPGQQRVLIYSGQSEPLPSGELIQVSLTITSSVPAGFTSLVISNAILSDRVARTVTPTTLTPGTLRIMTALPARLGAVLVSTNGLIQFLVEGTSGRPYVIEASTDLATWTPIGTNQPANGMLEFVDPHAGRYPQRFYRACAPQ